MVSKQGDVQPFLKSRVCLSPFWGFWNGLIIPRVANPAACSVVLLFWALHPPVSTFQADKTHPELLIPLAVSVHPHASQHQ